MKILLVTSEYGEQGGGLSFACTLFYGILSESLGHDVILLSSCEEIIKTAQGGYNASLKSKISNEYRLKNDTLKLNLTHNMNQKNIEFKKEDVAASFQDVATNILIKKVKLALEKYGEIKTFVAAGGVAANSGLREKLENLLSKKYKRR